MNSKSYGEKSNILKFALFSIVGFFIFLVPIPYEDTFTIPIGIIINWVESLIENYTLVLVLIFVSLNALGTLITKIFKPSFIMNNNWLKATFDSSMLYTVSRVIGMIIIIMFYFQVGPEFIISDITAGVMVDLMRTLVSVLIVISFLMPLLTEFGIMEFLGVLLTKIVRPFFLVPGRAAVDLVTSWLGASNAAVLLTKQQYDKGFYSGKEAATIMTNFSFVSIPFAYIIASVLMVEEYFTQFYLICTISGFAIAMIIPRIYPLTKVTDKYSEKVGKQASETVPEGMTRFQYAVYSASKRASTTAPRDVFTQGIDMFTSVIFVLAPLIIGWGTIALILVEFTPVFTIIAYPMGLLLQVLGIPEAMQAAPATLTGFADMFIPPLMLASVESFKTRFIVGAATLLQLIYMTEVGIIILQSDVPIGFKDLVIIFLERTILALLLVTGLSMLIMTF